MERILLATILSFLNVHSSLLGKPVLKWVNRQTANEKKLLSEKIVLKVEQNKISMADNFAKHAKIQRKINVIDQQLNEIKSNKSSSNLIMQVICTYGIKVALGLILLVLSIYYRYTPLFSINKNLSLSPFTSIICYPNEENSVSFHFWVMCCAAFARLIKLN